MRSVAREMSRRGHAKKRMVNRMKKPRPRRAPASNADPVGERKQGGEIQRTSRIERITDSSVLENGREWSKTTGHEEERQRRA